MNFIKTVMNMGASSFNQTMPLNSRRLSRSVARLLVALATVGVMMAATPAKASAQAAPPYLVYSQTPLSGPESVNPMATFGGFRGHPAFNSRGDLFVSDGSGQHVYEYPANGGPAILVFTDTAGNQFSGVAVDPFDNLFIGVFSYNGPSGTNDQNSLLYEFPSTNGAYQGLPYVFNSTSPPGSCLPAVPATGTTPAVPANTTVCSVGFYQGAIFYYWQGPFDTAVDSQGNVYNISGYLSADNSTAETILQCQLACAQQIPGNGASDYSTKLSQPLQSLATDYAGNLYFADNTNVSIIPVNSPSTRNAPTILDSSYTTPYGVSFDPSNNLYVADAIGIWEVPAVEANGDPCKGGTDQCTLKLTSKYLVIPLPQGATPGIYSSYLAPAIDNRGNIVFTPSYGSLAKASLWSGSFPSAPIGTTAQIGSGGLTALNFTISFNSETTIASLAAVQGAAASTEFALNRGTCTPGSTFAAKTTCTFSASFTPSGLGVRSGTIILTDSTGKATSTFLTGTGLGTGVTVDPGTPVQVASGLNKPAGVAVDGTGNVYVADSAASTVTEYPAGDGAAVSIGTGLNVPTGVAVDAGGNVYIVNQGTGATGGTIVQVPSVAGVLSNSGQKTLITGLNLPTDIVTDGNANLYVSATGSNQVLQLSNASRIDASSATVSRGYGLSGPTGLALDSSGNLFVADTGNNRVLQIGDGFQIAVGSGLTAPTGVTTDPSGSVIIADGTGRLIRVPNESFGKNAIGLNQADQQVLSSPLSYPYSVRSDPSGNLYVSDSVAAVVEQLQRSTGAVNFGKWNLNTVSDTQTLVLSNIGTEDVTIGNPVFAPVPASSEFSVTSGSGLTACGPGLFHSGFNCTVLAAFDPTVTGESTYPLTFNATAKNTASPTVNLTGTGVNAAAATLTLIQVAPTTPTISYGQQIIISANVSPSGTTPTPTGFIVFNFNGQNQRPVMLDSTGAASITFNGLNAGSNTLSAFYEGDANYASLNSDVLPLNIQLATSTNVLTVVGDSAVPLSVQPTDTLTFTDVLTPSVVGLFTGTVDFINVATNKPLNSTPLRLGSPDPKTGLYTVTFALQGGASAIDLGSYNVVAVYSGNTNYLPTNSATIPYVVIKTTYTVTPDTTSVTASAAAPGVVNLTVTDYSNFQGNVSLQCSGLPANAYCVFRPASAQLIPAAGALPNTQLQPLTIYPVPITVQIKVDTSIVPIQSSRMPWLAALLLGFAFAWRRRLKTGAFGLAAMIAVFCLVGLTALSGCGSSTVAFPTPPGNSVVTVTSTATPFTSSGQVPACSYQNCNLPPDPVTNPSINVVKTFTFNLTVK